MNRANGTPPGISVGGWTVLPPKHRSVGDAAVALLAAFGAAIEVLQPMDLRQRLAELGRQLSSVHGGQLTGPC